MYDFGGSPIGNSRVKLTNVEDCIKKGFVKEGENPLDVAAKQLEKDEIENDERPDNKESWTKWLLHKKDGKDRK